MAVLLESNYFLLFSMGIAYGAIGKHQKKSREFEETIRIEPTFAVANFELGIAHAALKQHREAGKSYQQALKLDPQYPHAHYFMALSYYISKRYMETILMCWGYYLKYFISIIFTIF